MASHSPRSTDVLDRPVPPLRPAVGGRQLGPNVRGVPSSLTIACLAVAVAVAVRLLDPRLFRSAGVQTWSTVFVSISLQALPFLMLGIGLSATIAAIVRPGWLQKALPRRPSLAVPCAALAGAVLPGCECGSVPLAGRLVSQGAMPSAALAFMLSAPAINPVVLVATAVAFPGQPRVVVARFVASLATAVVMGTLWQRFGRDSWMPRAARFERLNGSAFERFLSTARHDFLQAGGFLVLGAMTAATLRVVVPASALNAVAGSGLVAVLSLAVLAVVLAVCSEADAFVAATFTQFSPMARLAFMVVGPAVDVKLVALQAGVFGRRFAVRFGAVTFVVAVLMAVAVGWWLL